MHIIMFAYRVQEIASLWSSYRCVFILLIFSSYIIKLHDVYIYIYIYIYINAIQGYKITVMAVIMD